MRYDKWVVPSAALLLLALSGCATSQSAKYKDAREAPPLELPPGLLAPPEDSAMAIPAPGAGSATYSAYVGDRAAKARPVLPVQETVRVEHDGAQRWLVVEGDPAQLWPWLKEFWESNGYTLDKEDPDLGVLETAWRERKPAPDAAAVRDRYRLRLERAGNMTELHMTHQQLIPPGSGAMDWQAGPSNPELAIDMLKRLALFLGVKQQALQGLEAAPASAATPGATPKP